LIIRKWIIDNFDALVDVLTNRKIMFQKEFLTMDNGLFIPKFK